MFLNPGSQKFTLLDSSISIILISTVHILKIATRLVLLIICNSLAVLDLRNN